MRAELRHLFSAGAGPLGDYRPNGPFGIWVDAIVGPYGDQGEESFGFMVCTPEWFASEHLPDKASIAIGRHFIFVREFNYPALEKFVREYCASCEGDNWRSVAEKVARIGYWEFEDYKA